MAGSEDKLWAETINGQHKDKRHKVRLTDKCKPVLVGTDVKGPGDTIELFATQARELCESGAAEPVGLGWFTMPPAREPAPKPEPSPRLDEPGNGSYKVQVLPGKAVFLGGDRSYGDNTFLYLSEEQARQLLTAGRIKLIKPDRLPAHVDHPKNLVSGVGRFGCSGMIPAPTLASENVT